MPGGVDHLPFPATRYSVGEAVCLNALQHLFRSDVDPKAVAAVIVEPVQGDGGFHVGSPNLMNALRAICDENGILLIADDVQSGFGRTGKTFAIEHYEVRPDIVTMAKALAGGFLCRVLLAVLAIMDSVEPGGLGGAYAGSPAACPLKQQCCPTQPMRKVIRSVHEAAREEARGINATLEFAQSRRDRKKVEMLFALLQPILKLDRLRLRGPYRRA